MTTAMTTTQAIRPTSFSEMKTIADAAARSAFAGAYRGKPEDAFMAIMHGAELGLSPSQSLSCVAVIQGKPAVYGDALIGICRASQLCEDIVEEVSGQGDEAVATCTAKRRGSSAVVRSFSVKDAKRAGLWGKSGPWSAYPLRMLAMRARAWALRDAFPDLLKGILPVEEARDIDAQPQSVTAEVIEPVPPPPPPPQPAVAKDDLVPAARAAIKRARSADGLSKLRARIEARVMNGDMDAADAEQLVNELEQKLHTLEEENADSE